MGVDHSPFILFHLLPMKALLSFISFLILLLTWGFGYYYFTNLLAYDQRYLAWLVGTYVIGWTAMWIQTNFKIIKFNN